MLSRVIGNIFCHNLNNRNTLREVMVKVKIGLEIIDMQEEVTVEILVLLDSGTTGLAMSLEFAGK